MTLNKKQKLFLAKYLQCFNATQAAIDAGYSEKTAYSIGHELLKKPEIALHIRKYQDENIAQAKEVLYHLTVIARDIGNETTSNRLKALDLLARYHQLTNTINVKGWQDELIVKIRQGELDYDDVKFALSALNEDESLARQLFYVAGVDVELIQEFDDETDDD